MDGILRRIIAIRSVDSLDAMTADWTRIPYDILEKISNRIINNITLKFVINTHSHGDHTVGNSDLLKNSDAQCIDYQTLINNGLELDNEPVHIFKTPEHTSDSVIF